MEDLKKLSLKLSTLNAALSDVSKSISDINKAADQAENKRLAAEHEAERLKSKFALETQTHNATRESFEAYRKNEIAEVSKAKSDYESKSADLDRKLKDVEQKSISLEQRLTALANERKLLADLKFEHEQRLAKMKDSIAAMQG